MTRTNEISFEFYVGFGNLGRTPEWHRHGTGVVLERGFMMGLGENGLRVRVTGGPSYKVGTIIEVCAHNTRRFDRGAILWALVDACEAASLVDEPHDTDGPMNYDDTGERENDAWAARVGNDR